MKPFKTKSAGLTDVGFWNRFWARLSGRPRLEAGESARGFDGVTTESGESVSGESALRLSAVWACVKKRADIIGTLPLHVRNPDKTLARKHPLYDLLHNSPNADMTAAEFFGMQLVCMDVWGNGYSIIGRNSQKRINALTPKNPANMSVKRLKNGRLHYTYQGPRSDPEEYDEDDVLHFREFTLDGIVGLSPIEYAAETMGDVLTANRSQSREFRQGLKIGGFIQAPDGVVLEDPMRQQMSDNLSRYSLPENVGKFMVLEGGFKFIGGDAIRMSPKISQLLESRYFGIEEICRIYGVPPPIIGHTDKASSWASSLSNLNQGFLTYCLQPTMVRMEQRMAKKLLSSDERGEFDIGFNFRALLRGNFSEQSAAYGAMLDRGVYCADEVRDYEDLPPLPDGKGKEYRVPLNMAPAGTPPPAPAPVPTSPPAPKEWLEGEFKAIRDMVQRLEQRQQPITIHNAPPRVDMQPQPLNLTIGKNGGTRVVHKRDPLTGLVVSSEVQSITEA